MNKKEAIQAMLDGKKVTPMNSVDCDYCYYDDLFDRPFRFVFGNDNRPINASWGFEKWEIYEEYKKKVKMWQWIYKPSCRKDIRISKSFYENEDEARRCLIGGTVGKIIQCADWTEIEVNRGR